MRQSLVQTQAQVLKQVPKPVQVMASNMLLQTDAEIAIAISTALDVNVAIERSEDSENHGYDEGDPRETASSAADMGDNRDDDDELYSPRYASAIGFEQAPATEMSLNEELEAQINERELSDFQRKIARYIIGNLDDHGYLRRRAEQISDDIIIAHGTDIDPDELDNQVREMIEVVRDLNPAGVGATDLRDCMLLQLGRMKGTRINSLAFSVVQDHFNDLAAHRYEKICRDIKASKDEWDEIHRTIRRLNPKPAGQFVSQSQVKGNQIIPDFRVSIENESLTLELTNKIPELQISRTYSDFAASPKSTAIERDMVDRARNFIQALKMRQNTLFTVMSAILKRQSAFFFSGDDNDLKPMVIKDIEAETGIDTSMISRATSGRYVDTQWGVFPLRHFFSESIKTSDGDDVSNKEVMSALRDIIAAEDKRHPHSDERLGELLAERGYPIARRTVAKYRENMQIPPARQRKEL